MNRRHFLVSAASLPLAGAVRAQTAASQHAGLQHTGSRQRKLNSAENHAPTTKPLYERYRLTRDRVVSGGPPSYTPDFVLQDITASGQRRFTEFSGDVSGRWLGALSSASATFGDRFEQLHALAASVIALQHPEGYFGKSFSADHPDDNDLALLWGNGRLLVGLMEYHAFSGNAAARQAGVWLGEFLLRIAPVFNSKKMAEEFGASHFASSYICWTQQTEGLAALYSATRDERFRALCEAISERMERRPADHVHGYLCSVRGTLYLYEITGDKALLARVERAWTDISNSGDLLLTGGVPEAWSPKKLRTEGCAECDWLRLNLALWRTTHDPKYIETAERVFFNDFSQNQFATGDFGHAELTSLGVPGFVAVKSWWCCTLHGLRAFSDVHRHVFEVGGQNVLYALPLDARCSAPGLDMFAQSALASNGSTTITVRQAPAGQTLTIRKPSWADSLSAVHNGRLAASLDGIAIASGDRIEITYKLNTRNVPAGTDKLLASRTAFFVGPWLLGASAISNPAYFNELQTDNRLHTTLTPSREDHVSVFSVPVAARSTEFLPAEYPIQPARVELRAIAEQTASPSAKWEMAFLTT